MVQGQIKQKAALALLLFVPAASLGIAARLYSPGLFGAITFVATRVWLIALPLLWFLKVDRAPFTPSPPSAKDWRTGLGLGLLMLSIIWIAYVLGQHWLNPITVQEKAQQVGLTNPTLYIVSTLYFTFINSFIEEYTWRGFVYRHCETLIPGLGAVCLAALCFTLHHTIALAAYTGNGWVVLLGSLGVFSAGALWSWCYLTSGSLWACYISHVLADVAIALIGWQLLFSPTISLT
ncbi:CPBP family intramembrane metalloprotease [Leptolyngbya sp. FACHB-16]|nr:CPBP family intramembrane metalloprotease [Leptolyngbya sp. FACHB-8]MBD2155013.1 CPBP family intramembrane metalloprotease [Leptolyngbya sp. FACHB-16]